MGSGQFPFEWPFPANPSRGYTFWSRNVMRLVFGVSKIGLDKLNKIKVYGPQHILTEAMEAKKPILSFTNHISNVDDPFLWGQFPWRTLMDPIEQHMRWAPCAVDVCFTKPFHRWMFSMGQCVPFLRDGSGVYQKGVDFCIERLNANKWVHIYPQGRCNLTQDHMRFKWGIGRMLAESQEALLLPFYHMGMDSVMPMSTPYYPRFGKRVTILYGEPISYRPTLAALEANGASPREKRKVLTDLCEEKMYELWPKAAQLHAARTD